MKKNLLFFLVVCSLLGTTTVFESCSDSNEELKTETPFLKVTEEQVNFNELADEQKVTVKCNSTWDATVEGDGQKWCSVTKDNGGILIKVTDNEEKSIREATVVVSAQSVTKKIKVAQLGWGKAILLSKKQAEVPAIGGSVELEVTTNVDYTVDLNQIEWVREASKSRASAHPVVTTTRSFKVDANGKDTKRSATLTVKDVDAESDLAPVEFKIVQDGTGDYEAVNPEGIKDDIKVKVIGGKASSFQPGTNIDLSYDGKMETIYHSNWDNKATNYFPITLEYEFERGTDMDYMIYYPRTSGGNGHFKEVDIEVKSYANSRGEDEWKKVLTYNFEGSSSPTRVEFPEALIGVSTIRLVVKSGSGDGQGFAACAEMEFYRKNPEAFNYETLFTDATCSELKEGITEREINECPYSFFKNIAYFLYYNKYNKEFRVNTFKAYPHPDVQGRENKTSPYNLLDNATGISVEKDEILVVMADKLPASKVYLKVQNLDAPGADGYYNSLTYPLAVGINKLKMKQKGLVYVLYHTPEYETSPEVKLHFASGTVNGYFDSQNPAHKGREKELLAAAKDKYFDVLGKYAHLTYPTSRFRNHTKDLRKLIDTFDTLVYNEQELLGLVRYNRFFKNRMYFHVMYTSYMYATDYRTAYNDDTLAELCDETALATRACWGPAHEVGHCNQTRPGLRWLGTTEVTNNIMSEYIQTTVFNQPSRVQTEDMHDPVSKNRYSKAWNNIIVGKISHAAEGDVFCKLIPFWQLELYFGKVLGLSPRTQTDKGGFYPDVYEHVRTHDNLPTPGKQQIEFVYIASKAAKMDLTDFFEKWGFLTPVDIELDDYGKGMVQVSKDDADEIRRRVADLGFKKPEVPLEYITDNNVEVFKNKADIVPGSAERRDDTLIMKNWKNVVVYEVRADNENGTLICVSDGVLTPSATASFDVKGGWNSNYKVYAVSYDNKRVAVPVK